VRGVESLPLPTKLHKERMPAAGQVSSGKTGETTGELRGAVGAGLKTAEDMAACRLVLVYMVVTDQSPTPLQKNDGKREGRQVLWSEYGCVERTA
jgi:hypothetical protein